jgi:hypothetical protein
MTELTPAQIVIELAVTLASERVAHATTRAETAATIAQLRAVVARLESESRALGADMTALAERLVTEVIDDPGDVWPALREVTLEIADRFGVSLPTSN